MSVVLAQLLQVRYEDACQGIGSWRWCESAALAITRGSALSFCAAAFDKDRVLLDEDDHDESPAEEKAGRSCLTV